MMGRALVVGGGFYGCAIATMLAEGGAEVVLMEAEDRLLARASYANQARLHGGYHYPRSHVTALRSRLNLQRFMQEYREAVVDNFAKCYAIAARGSHVSVPQFERFCAAIGAPLWRASPTELRLFEPRMIAGVWRADEYGFDAAALARIMAARLACAGVEVRLNARVASVTLADGVTVHTASGGASGEWLFNCTYSALNGIPGLPPTRLALKHERVEMPLIALPAPLRGTAITVMDGPFFSVMPFVDRGLSTLSHVRYTPHASWQDGAAGLPAGPSRFAHMVRDAARYVPAMEDARQDGSLFEVKTVLLKNEGDDGRPILFDHAPATPNVVAVLGAKLDNIYDVLDATAAHIARHR